MSKRLSAHYHQWDVMTKAMSPKKKAKKVKREPSVCRVFKATLDWVTERNPTLSYEERCKSAANISRVTKKNGFRLPGTRAWKKRAAIWQRRLHHQRAEKTVPRVALDTQRKNPVIYI